MKGGWEVGCEGVREWWLGKVPLCDMRNGVIAVGLLSMTTCMRGKTAANELESKPPCSLSSLLPLRMGCRCSLRIVTAVLLVLINLPSTASAALFGTTCDRTTYGLPEPRACDLLLFGDAAFRSGGIFDIDSLDHGFLLPFFGHRSQFTDWQWRHRVTLPQVWRTRRLPSFACQ